MDSHGSQQFFFLQHHGPVRVILTRPNPREVTRSVKSPGIFVVVKRVPSFGLGGGGMSRSTR